MRPTMADAIPFEVVRSDDGTVVRYDRRLALPLGGRHPGHPSPEDPYHSSCAADVVPTDPKAGSEMTRPRKTVDLVDLVKRVNRMAEFSHGLDPVLGRPARNALYVLIESVLTDANAYNGFGYSGPDNTGHRVYYRPRQPISSTY